MSEQERRKMEVRERLEQEAGGKRKKGFMTPERKKKLRVRRALMASMASMTPLQVYNR